jgi:hypothetical protein
MRRRRVVFVNFTIPRSFVTRSLAKYTPLDTGMPEFCVEFQVTVYRPACWYPFAKVTISLPRISYTTRDTLLGPARE